MDTTNSGSSSPTLILSAGHHQGAVGASHLDITEWPRTVEWVDLIAAHCAEKVPVYVFRNELLSRKIKAINLFHPTPKLCVEVHFNSSPRGGAGSETLYCPGSSASKLLAERLQPVLAKFSRPDRGIKEGWYKQDADMRVPDAFLSQTKPVAVILEPFFVQQNKEMKDDEVMKKCCAELGAALLRELGV